MNTAPSDEEIERWVDKAFAHCPTLRHRSYLYHVEPAPSQHWAARAWRAFKRWL